MSVFETSVLPDLHSVRVYWRTKDAEGEIPRPLQTWWVSCYDSGGLLLAMPVDQDLIDNADNLVDLVVAVGDRLDQCFTDDQVRLDTGHRTAEWQRGY